MGAYSQKCEQGYGTASPHVTKFQPQECINCKEIYFKAVNGIEDELYDQFVAK